MTISTLLATMIGAAKRAGDGLVVDQTRLSTLTVRGKLGPSDMVSDADLRAEETVRAALMAAQPDFAFLGEEGGLTPGSDPAHLWIVDPLDGTTNFLTGSPLFAVNIALARDGEVIAGVTHVPQLGETFHAETGGGAWLNDTRIRVSHRAAMHSAVLAVGIPHAAKPRHGQFLAEMARLTGRVAGIRRLGAGAIDMAWVACGRMDAYWEQDISAWDMAAGVVLVREAGGVVTNTLGGKLDLMGGTVLASTEALHPALIEALQPV
ncbi:MAG: inositol monophosphatase [Sphingomonas bacterium]|nr:inositol monophosphatase [Sphingomonas bacterium]